MTEAALPEALQALVDKQAIYEVVLRGCRGGDRFDLDMIMSVFHDGAQMHNVAGFSGSCEDLRAFLAPIRESFTGGPATYHMLGQPLRRTRRRPRSRGIVCHGAPLGCREF